MIQRLTADINTAKVDSEVRDEVFLRWIIPVDELVSHVCHMFRSRLTEPVKALSPVKGLCDRPVSPVSPHHRAGSDIMEPLD